MTGANWQATKVGAIAAGWYDTRSGLGDFLTAYMTADAEFQKTPNTETVVAVDAALGELTDAFTAVGTMSNDPTKPHQGMVDYIDAMYKLAETTQNEIWKKRQELFDKAQFGDLPPEEMEQKKAEAMENAKQLAMPAAEEEKSAAHLEQIKTAWDKHKHKTPYGNATLPDFVSKAVARNSTSTPRKRWPWPARRSRSARSASSSCGASSPARRRMVSKPNWNARPPSSTSR